MFIDIYRLLFHFADEYRSQKEYNGKTGKVKTEGLRFRRSIYSASSGDRHAGPDPRGSGWYRYHIFRKDSDEKTVNVSFDQQKEDSHLEAGCLSESKEELTYRDTELFRESEDDDSSKLDGARYYLIRLSTKERISIIGREFVIGRSAEQADYAIKDNIWISNIHASILKTNEGCFIRDLGSLNHTYLNDTLIEVRTEKLIPNGAIIRMGNERFQFECVGALNG